MKLGTKKLKCDKPYDIDEARKKKGLPRRKRSDSRTTAYELTIRIPEEYRTYFDNKKKLTRVVFALNRKDDLKSQIESFENEKNAELERKQEERGGIGHRGDGLGLRDHEQGARGRAAHLRAERVAGGIL